MPVIGIDEAGRGALAGPVVVAALVIPPRFYPKASYLPRLRDSKKLSPRQRSVWFQYIKEHPDISYATARVYQRKIEAKNIRRAADMASTQSLQRLLRFTAIAPHDCFVYLDGGLSILDEPLLDELGPRIKTVIRGDEKLVAIKLASIVAKVTRDNYMLKLHQRYPNYALNLHKGYGTALHQRRIKRLGPARIHRLTYLKGLVSLN
ncbi:MAG TPA: ribonuclease HII [Candidatus Paceibacterota bacterium]